MSNTLQIGFIILYVYAWFRKFSINGLHKRLDFLKTNNFHVQQDYLSILYLQMPESFRIILRGTVVKLHNIADDLKDIEFILYKPQRQSGCSEEVPV